MTDSNEIAAHYSGGDLLSAIEQGLKAAGKDPISPGVADLGPVDEFHIGGRKATGLLCEALGVAADSSILDVGCGIGGTARFMADQFGCGVTGIDLTPEYIKLANVLSERADLSDRLTFEHGSALQMPFPDSSFDLVTQLHVGMNIADKAALFIEVARVLKPGGRFGIYDIMGQASGEDGVFEDPEFPVPWATNSSMSFVVGAENYETALQSAGFTVTSVKNRREFALEFFGGGLPASSSPVAPAPPPLGIHIIMGPEAPVKIRNMVAAVKAGILAPVEMICVKQ